MQSKAQQQAANPKPAPPPPPPRQQQQQQQQQQQKQKKTKPAKAAKSANAAPTMRSVLTGLKVNPKYINLLHEEAFDLDALKLADGEDLEEIGLPPNEARKITKWLETL